MSSALYIRLATLKDRIKLRLLQDEARDLKADIALCEPGGEACQSLAMRQVEVIDAQLHIMARLGRNIPPGIIPHRVPLHASSVELFAVVVVAAAACIASAAIVLASLGGPSA